MGLVSNIMYINYITQMIFNTDCVVMYKNTYLIEKAKFYGFYTL